MATYASSDGNTCILKGMGIGGAMADLPKPEKRDSNDTKPLADLSKPAKHLECTEVEASNFKQKCSLQDTKMTNNAQTSNILDDEKSKECFEWEETDDDDHDHDHAMCIKMEKRARDLADSELGDWDWDYIDYSDAAEFGESILFDCSIPTEEEINVFRSLHDRIADYIANNR